MIYTLRQATQEDAELLFNIKIEAMRPVHSLRHPGEVFNYDEEFKKYLVKFVPANVKVIQYNGKDVGRFRTEKLPDTIYIGGLQILPEFQNKGVGSAILGDLITDANNAGVFVTLEVSDLNHKAIALYKRMGFVENGKVENGIGMIYRPQ
jgi:ribosomal protein S18 acetylase RimI-like enzyme